MAANYLQVNFRMPENLKARLEKEARANTRSLTAEIIHRLETSLGAETPEKKNIHPDDQALLDAHGMTEEQAKAFVLAFLNTYDRLTRKKP